MVGQNTSKYLGFYVEACGYQQWEVNAERLEVAGKHPLVTNEMRKNVYSAKVRFPALLGSDISGWRRLAPSGAEHIDPTKVIANLYVS